VNMLNVILVDDEENGLVSLSVLLTEIDADIRLIEITTSPTSAINAINQYKPDVVFMDIQMPGLDGFAIIEKLEFLNFQLVFTTAHKQYGLRALKKGAVDYLLKPINRKELSVTIENAKKRIREQENNNILNALKTIRSQGQSKIMLPLKESVEFVKAEDLVYLEARGRHCIAALRQGPTLEVLKPLGEFEVFCQPDMDFMRVHKSFIVNLNHIKRISRNHIPTITVSGNKTIPISARLREELIGKVSQYKI
jgi:two-component system LytT family response regulator